MEWTELLRPETRIKLLQNFKDQQDKKGTGREIDFEPVAKLFVPWGAATFLITECDGDGLAFGLSDLGFGTPELGYISLDELSEIRGPGGLCVEEDLHFRSDKPLSGYAADARSAGRIRV
jgi:hypothetical protein